MIEVEQHAYLLHSRPYQEHNYIVELLTEYEGKVSAIAYIGKGLKNNKKALLQPFHPLNIVLKGRNALKILSRIESSSKSLNIVGEHLFSGFYLNELVVRLMTEQHPCLNLFNCYQQCLSDLALNKPLEKILRHFEMMLLIELGVLFDFSKLNEFTDVKQQDEQGFILNYGVEKVCFSAEQGFVPVLNNQQIPCYTATYTLEHLHAIAAQRLDSADVMFTYKRLMRQVINALLGNKPLNSRKFFTNKQTL